MQPINLLPDLKTRRRQRLQLSLPRLLAIAAGVWLLVLALVYGLTWWQKHTLAAELAVMANEITALDAVAERAHQLKDLQVTVTQLQQLLAANKTGVIVPHVDLFASLLPPAISAQQITAEPGKLHIACLSTSLQPIGQLYTNLQQSGRFTRIQFSTINNTQLADSKITGYSFSVTVIYQEVQSDE